MSHFEKIKNHLTDLDLEFKVINLEEQVLTVNDSTRGFQNLVVDCEDSVLILEQFICVLDKPQDSTHLKTLLQLNRQLVHGAFVLDDSGDRVLFRDTLQLANLDRNELDASVTALSLGLAEHADKLIDMAKK